MRFLDLYISGFGKLHNTSVSFEDGINVIYGKNEAGKSTIHTFIRSMIFGIERQRGRAARTDLYSRFEPWENSSTYEGQLRVESDGIIYRIERSFLKQKKEFIIVNETTGREVEPTKAFLDDLLCGLNETTYNNTISISQLKSATDEGMISELKNYIANMNTSGNMALNITKATAYLKNQRKQLESQLMPEAARTYASLLSEIRNTEKEISSPGYENQIQKYQRTRRELSEEIELCQAEKAELAGKVERGRQVLEDYEFTDESSVAAYLDKAEKIYRDYEESKAAVENHSDRMLPVLSFLSMIVGILGALYFGYFYLNPYGGLLPAPPISVNPLTCAIVFGAVGLILLFTLLSSLSQKRQCRREAQLCMTTISEIFKRHLGSSAISEEAMEAFRTKMAEFSRLCQMILQSEKTLREQTARIGELKDKQERCGEEIEQQQRTQWELEKKLEHLSDCKDRAAALKQIIAENDRLRQEIEAIDMAQETMKSLSTSIRDSFGLYLNKTASELIGGITGGIYSSMSIDENLNAFLNTKKKLIPLEQVSSGTADQIYLALRLAAAKMIQGGEDRMPLIFDDSFALYDDDRLRTALSWLPTAYRGQMIIFTCHRRESRLLGEIGLPYHLIEI